MTRKLVRFDWAIKKLLKNRADFDVLEGFLSVLLNQEIKIEEVLDSESNKDTPSDKHNRVDVLVKNQFDERIIIEVQNSKELDYFHRMAYGTSKVISQHIGAGQPYGSIKKVISITIAYFDLGEGEDYVYHGTNQFRGLHRQDTMTLERTQMALYNKKTVHEIFPEYWIIKADKFSGQVEDKLDEWIYFLKNSEVKEEFTAPGLHAAREKLNELKMSEEERREYQRYLKHLMNIASENHTKQAEIQIMLEESEQKGREKGLQEGIEKGLQEGIEKGLQEGIEKGLQQKELDIVMNLHRKNFTPEEVAELANVPLQRVRQIIKENS